jgi:hypothetical protein
MKLDITTWQRVMRIQVVGELRGNVAMIRQAMKALDALELSEEEKVQVGFSDLLDGGAKWNGRDHRFEVEIRDEKAAELVRLAVQHHQEWPITTAKQVLDLALNS